jgi:hypothetical protein
VPSCPHLQYSASLRAFVRRSRVHAFVASAGR